MAILRFFQASKNHFGARDVFLGVFQVFEESVFAPDNAFSDICSSVAKTSRLARLPAKKTIQIRSNFMSCTLKASFK